MHKLTLSLLFVVLIAILGMGWALDGLFEYFSAQPAENDISTYSEIGTSLAKMIDQTEQAKDIITGLNIDGRLHLMLKNLDEFPLPEEIQSTFLSGGPLALESEGDLTLNYFLPAKQQVLTLTSPLLSENNKGSPLSLLFTLLFYAGITALLLLWLYPLIKQLIQLKLTAYAFGRGDLNQRISPGSVSYIADIENSFNQMAQQIQTLVSDNKLLASAVSHDLRTPLARLRFGIDALSEVTDQDTRLKYEKRISQDVGEMESLVETLLNYARLDQSMIKLKKSPVYLNQVIQHCVNTADKNGITLEVKSEHNKIIINGDEETLCMLINNILGNALQYASKHILITLNEKTEQILVSIEDDGPGIPENEQGHVLKPFVRGKNNETSRQLSQGYGMGLAIAKRIAELHDGKVLIRNSKRLGGAKIIIIIPGPG